jgi:hypothetical protein
MAGSDASGGQPGPSATEMRGVQPHSQEWLRVRTTVGLSLGRQMSSSSKARSRPRSAFAGFAEVDQRPWYESRVMKSRRGKVQSLTKLRLELDSPATPALVMQIAKLFQQALEAAGQPLEAASVTMVVGNLTASAELRGRDEPGSKAVESITNVVGDTVRALQEDPRARMVAEALAENASGLERLDGRFKVGRKTVARFDETLVGAMRGASADTFQGVVTRGRDQIYSRVLRVGRLTDDGHVKARLHIHNSTCDIDVAEPIGGFVDALKSGRMQRIDVATEWTRNSDSSLTVNLRKTRALSTCDFEPVAGQEFIEGFSDGLDADLVEQFMVQTEAEL